MMVWRGDLVLKEEGNIGSSSRSNKGWEVVCGSNSGSCIPESLRVATQKKLIAIAPELVRKDQGTFNQDYINFCKCFLRWAFCS